MIKFSVLGRAASEHRLAVRTYISKLGEQELRLEIAYRRNERRYGPAPNGMTAGFGRAATMSLS